MKKLLSVTMVLLMTVFMTVSSAALLSPVNNGSIISRLEGVDANNNIVTPTIEEDVDDEIAKEATSPEIVKSVLGDSYDEGMVALTIVNITVPEGTVFPVKLTIYVPGLTADSKGSIIHYNEQEKRWEKIETVFYDGYAVGTFYSLSPTAVIIDNETATAIEKIYNSNGTGTPQSPQTADFTSAAIICAIGAVILGAINITFSKKK